MKTISVVVVAVMLTACATPEQQERNRLTDRIEDRVKLPEGAMPLFAYARHYAFDKNGLVVGIYSRGFKWPNPDDVYEELLEDFSSREIPCSDDLANEAVTLAGQRRWVDNTNQLPGIMDGGCSVVTVIFDPKADVVKGTYCNGEA